MKTKTTELKKGIAEEYEHETSLKPFLKKGINFKLIATAIAKDHLKKDPQYYTKLLKIEKQKPLSETKTNFVKLRLHPPYDKDGKTVFNIRGVAGVYMIYKHDKLLYIGYSTNNLYRTMYRHLQNWNDKSQYRATYKNLKGIAVRVVYTKTAEQASKLEQALILKYSPPDNLNKYADFEPEPQEKQLAKDFINEPTRPDIMQHAGDLPF